MATPDLAAVAALVESLPPGPGRDELLHLACVGAKFKAQQRGRRPGFLSRYIEQIAAHLPPPPTFAALLDEMESEAARRSLYGEQASPVEQVNRVWELVTIHTPRGERKVPFKTLRNTLTACRRKFAR